MEKKTELIEKLNQVNEEDFLKAIGRWIGLDTTEEGTKFHVDNFMSILEEYIP